MSHHNIPWQKILIVVFSLLVVGNAATTLVLYAMGLQDWTAWTGHVAQSTPSAFNDLLLGIVILLLGINLLRNHE